VFGILGAVVGDQIATGSAEKVVGHLSCGEAATPNALEDLLLQHPRRERAGDGSGTGGLLPREQPRHRGAVVSYRAYRWVAGNRARLVGYGEAAISYPPVVRFRERYAAQLRWLLRRLTPGE
jgi:hypothetical protein